MPPHDEGAADEHDDEREVDHGHRHGEDLIEHGPQSAPGGPQRDHHGFEAGSR
jgi:hypothetical protein